MPLPISFSSLTPALLAGFKTVTRRQWPAQHARKYHKGQLVKAYSKQPSYGGEWVGQVVLAEEPYYEHISEADFDEMYVREGFEWFDEQWERIVKDPDKPMLDVLEGWVKMDESYWVIEFPPATPRTKTLSKYLEDQMIEDSVNAFCPMFNTMLGRQL
jgi:hypothetical protein